MKKSIAQKVNLDYFDSNEFFAVVMTKGNKTYQFNYQNYEEAISSFKRYCMEEVEFCSLIGKKTIIGLWENLEGHDLICKKQVTINGLRPL